MIVFVHGVPETATIWRKVRSATDRESVALSLPGFGCARPDGFGASKDDYVDWLLGKLDKIEGPIDLVGHDWGAGFTYRVATAHGDRLHSWAADIGNIAHPDYEWHDFAKLWQTPGEGEAFVESQNASTPEERAPLFEAMGVPHDDALEMAAGSDATMGGCILALYRSATPNPYDHWGPWTPTSAPGPPAHRRSLRRRGALQRGRRRARRQVRTHRRCRLLLAVPGARQGRLDPRVVLGLAP